MPEKVEVVFGGLSLEVEPRFYLVALGILSLGIHVINVLGPDPGSSPAPGDDYVSIVFPDVDSVEIFSLFLLAHDFSRGMTASLRLSGLSTWR